MKCFSRLISQSTFEAKHGPSIFSLKIPPHLKNASECLVKGLQRTRVFFHYNLVPHFRHFLDRHFESNCSKDHTGVVTDGKREVSLGRPMYVVQANNTLKFNHGWTVDADYQFYSPFDELIMSVKKPIQQADIAVSKSFLANEALNIRLSCTDIFKSYIYSFHAEYGNIVIDQSNSNFRPCIQLRVSYRFNSANSKYKGTGAGQEAKDRM